MKREDRFEILWCKADRMKIANKVITRPCRERPYIAAETACPCARSVGYHLCQSWCVSIRLGIFICLLFLSWPCHANTENQTTTQSGPEALEKMIAREEANLTNQLATADQKARATADSGDNLGTYMAVLAGLVIAVLVLRKAWPVIAAPFFSDEIPETPAAPSNVPDVHAEVFSEFLEKFNNQQRVQVKAPASEKKRDSTRETKPSAPPQLDLPLEPIVVGHVNALDQVSAVRALFLELNRAASDVTRQECLNGLLKAVRGLRKGMRVSAAYSVGQMASALEELLGKLANQKDSLNISTMRTLAGGIDLLPALCSPGVRSDLASNPVISLLAVDDDAVSRHALTTALKRVWARPDLASNGEEGLRLAETRPYDLVFVDIEMPGMDGFELCFRIHGTPVNALTPVVFVTSHNDLAYRAKSSLVGGFEFLCKPFLSAELTVKALTLVLKRRLQQFAQPTPSTSEAQKNGETHEPVAKPEPATLLALK